MKKDFLAWHQQKAALDASNQGLYFRERDIWWCAVGCNIGFEQNGKGEQFIRPVLVAKKFSRHTFIGIPLSTTNKIGKYYHHFSFLSNVKSVALLSQIRLFDARRLARKMGVMRQEDFYAIKNAIRMFF